MEILLLLAIGILLPLVGQPQAIDVTEFSPNSTLFINKYIEFSKSSVSVDFDSILLASRQSTFRKLGDREMILLGYDPDFYWYRFSISNQKPLEQRVMLLLTQLAVREMEIFQGVNGQWASLGKTGYQYPFESRPYQYAHFVYPITVPPHSTSEFYVQVDDSHSYKVIAFALLHPVMLNGFQQGFYFFFGFMIGIMLLFFP